MKEVSTKMDRMKPTTVLLVLVLAFFVSCSKPDSAPPPAPPSTPAPAPPAPSAPVDSSVPTDSTASDTPAAPSNAATANSVGGDPIPGLPDYPGATRIGYSISPKVGFSKSVEAKYFTTEPFEKVKAFYAKAITAGGWRVISTKAKIGKIEWELAKGTSLAEIEVDQERTGGVEVKLERKDR
jgi:hypothetical protein